MRETYNFIFFTFIHIFMYCISSTTVLNTLYNSSWCLVSHISVDEITELRIWTAEKNFQLTDFNNKIEYTKKKIEKMKKLCVNSTLVTSSKDRSLILWNFLFTSVPERDKNNTEIKEFPYFLQPNPCRKFKFSDSPSHGICFPIISNINTESAVNEKYEKCEKYEQLWQITAIVNNRTIIVTKNNQNNLFNSKILSKITSNSSTDNKIIENKIENKINENMKYKSEIKNVLNFIPVFIPIKNMQKTAELFLKRKFQTSGQNMSVLRTWTGNSRTGGISEESRAGDYFIIFLHCFFPR